MSLLTKETKELIDKSPQQQTDVVAKLVSELTVTQKSLHEIPDSAPDDVVYHTPFTNDFKYISWYLKTLTKSTDLVREKNQVLIDVITYQEPKEWSVVIDGKEIETLEDILVEHLQGETFRVRGFISRRPFHTSLISDLSQFQVKSDVEVYFYVARVTDECSDAILGSRNIWFFEKEITVKSLGDVDLPIKSIKFESEADQTTLALGNSTLVVIPRKLFVDEQGMQEWIAVDHRADQHVSLEGACLPCHSSLHLDPEPTSLSVICRKVLLIEKQFVYFA